MGQYTTSPPHGFFLCCIKSKNMKLSDFWASKNVILDSPEAQLVAMATLLLRGVC